MLSGFLLPRPSFLRRHLNATNLHPDNYKLFFHMHHIYKQFEEIKGRGGFLSPPLQADMLPTPLVLAILKFLNLRSVIFLEHESDERDHTVSLLEAQNVYVQTVNPDSDDTLEELGKIPQTLVIHRANNNLSEKIDAQVFGRDIYWLVEEDGQPWEPPTRLRLDSNFFAVSNDYKITEWFRFSGMLLESDFASWSKTEGLAVGIASKKDRRRDLKGGTITIATLPIPEAVIPQMVDGRMVFTGFVPEIVEAFAYSSNFTPEWVFPEEKKFGKPLPNGTWNGLMGMLQMNKVDMVGTALATNVARSQVQSSMHSVISCNLCLSS